MDTAHDTLAIRGRPLEQRTKKEDFIHKHLKAIQIFILLGFKEKCKSEFSYEYIMPEGLEE